MKYLITTIAALVLVGCGPPEISILEAVSLGKIGAVKQHLAYGTDVNFKSENGETFLHLAVSEGHWDIVALLVKKGANVKTKETIFGYTPLHYTAKYSNPQTKDEIITLLIENGADVNAKAKNGETPMDLLNDALDLPGFESLRTNTKNLLRKHGAKMGEELNGGEPVAEAANPEPPTAKATDISIHDAAALGNIEAVKQHLAAGTDVNAKDQNGRIPLQLAAMKGHKEVAELLIAEGADVNAKSNGGSTPLHYAAHNSHKEIVELLIANGADVNAKDAQGYTPLGLAYVPGSPFEITQTANLLRKHGGKTGEELKAEGK